jgi:alkanesulfonate monooxygenase SsuD/methylene tetrahydromethanopterin reductase-like flavin-dependent oxidoreductase (luciferase family)
MVEPEPHSPGPLGFGVIAGLGRELLEPLATAISGLGFDSLWINDGGRPQADGLAGLAVVHAAAPGLLLGVGVLPLDRRLPAEIVTEVTRLGLPLDRLRLGVGSGGSRQPLELVRTGVAALRQALPAARIFIGALGPRMSRLAGEIADGVLFNWAVASRLEALSAIVAEGEREAGRRPIERWAYVRATIGPNARARLAAEARGYALTPAYGRAFDEMGVPFEQVGVARDGRDALAVAREGRDSPAGDVLAGQLQLYRRILDGVVVRALPVDWRLQELLEIARSAAGARSEDQRD